ncbi:MAG: hypothetical protein ACM3VT_06005 [Solirubrobacterales bacterium]
MMSQPSYITFRKHTFLSSLAMSLGAIIITLLVSCTVVALYTVHLASEKSEQVVALAQGAIKGLPEFTKSLPPALSDMLDDRRDPQYTHDLAISAKVVSQPDDYGRVRTEVEVVNNGDAVVSLLSLRITLVDDKEQLLCEAQEWAATPVAADGGWRGPILPGSKRHFVCYGGSLWGVRPADVLTPQVEVTELRVWNDAKDSSAPTGEPTTQAAAPVERAESGSAG